MTARTATGWLVVAGFWGGVVLAAAGPARTAAGYLTAPEVLLSLRDAGEAAGASRETGQSVVSIGDEPRVAMRVRPPARIAWAIPTRPGRYRVHTAVAVVPRDGARQAPIVFRVIVSSRDGERPLASVTVDPAGTSRSWRALTVDFETGPGPARLVLAAGAADGTDGSGVDGYWEAPALEAVTDPPRAAPVLFGLALMVACVVAARRRRLSLGVARNPAVWVAYTLVVAGVLLEATLRLAGWEGATGPRRLAVAGEASAAWMDATIEDPQLGYRYRPELSRTYPWREGDAPQSAVRFTTDGDGFRNPPGLASPRIVLLGDSFVEGDLVDEPATVRARLAGDTGVVVRNLGLSGYGPQQYEIAARRFGLPARPAWVVVALFEGNDLGDAEFFDQWRRSSIPWNDYVLDVLRSRGGSAAFRPHHPLRTLDALAAIGSGLWGRLVTPPQVTAPANPFDRRCREDPGGAGCLRFGAGFLYRETQSADEWRAGRGWALTRAALDGLKDLCRAGGARLLVVLVPTKESLYVPRAAASISPAAFDRFVAGAAGAPGTYFPAFLANHGALDRVIEPFLRQEGIDFLNLRPVFERAADEGRRLYFRLDMHWNARGHAAAARAIADRLHALGLS
jgi:hypothetical protein